MSNVYKDYMDEVRGSKKALVEKYPFLSESETKDDGYGGYNGCRSTRLDHLPGG